MLYHSVGRLNNAKGNVNPGQFGMQLAYLRENYDVVSLDRIIGFVKEGKRLPKKPVAITFDDGYYNVYQNAYPYLKKFRLPATIFITTGYVQKQMPLYEIQVRMLGWNEIKEMSKYGITFGAHTVTHPNLTQVDLETAKKEISKSREEIEANIGKEVKYFSSPFGMDNEDIVSLTRSMGFNYAFGRLSSKEFFQGGVNRLVLYRTEIDGSDSLWMFKVKLTTAIDWYHEFEKNASKIARRLLFQSKVDRSCEKSSFPTSSQVGKDVEFNRQLSGRLLTSVKDLPLIPLKEDSAMTNSHASVTIGVCVKNSERTIESTINSILKQKFLAELIEIVIVDGGSTDGTLPKIKDMTSKTNHSAEIFYDGGKGLGAARQIVVDNAKGDYIIFVDGDVEILDDFVKKQVDYMERHPKVGMAIGTYLFQEGNLLATISSLFTALTNPHMGTDATIFRAEVIREVGGFDLNMKGASEDMDLIYRVQKKGWAFSPNEKALFYHNCRPSLRGVWKEHEWYGFGGHYLRHKHRHLGPLWRRLPLGSFRWGFKLAKKGYRLTNLKISFLMPLFLVFLNMARWVGFFKAHIEGYGHRNNS